MDPRLREVHVQGGVTGDREDVREVLVDPLKTLAVSLDDHELLAERHELFHDLPARSSHTAEHDVTLDGL